MADMPWDSSMHFNGPEYSEAIDNERLGAQHDRIFALMKDGDWRTFREIATVTGDPEASISAQLRHLRKARFGSHTVERRSRGERSGGLFEYRLIVGTGDPCEEEK